MTRCMNCHKAVIVGRVVCSGCADLVERQQARIAELEAEVQGLRANSTIQEQIIRNGSNPLDKDKIVGLVIEKSALQAQLREAIELLGLAVADCNYLAYLNTTAGEKCNNCYKTDRSCRQSSDCWKWQHVDRYEALKAEMETTP